MFQQFKTMKAVVWIIGFVLLHQAASVVPESAVGVKRSDLGHADPSHQIDLLLQLLIKQQKNYLYKKQIEQCSAIILGNIKWKLTTFSVIHQSSSEAFKQVIDVRSCFFILATAEMNLTPLLDSLMKNPLFIVRVMSTNSARPVITKHEGRLPQVYMTLPSKRFIITENCREPRMGLLDVINGRIKYKAPSMRTPTCLYRIAYNPLKSLFGLKSETEADMMTREGYFVQTLLDYHSLTPEFVYANMTWGGYVAETDSYNGMVGLNVEDRTDMAVCYIAITLERYKAIDYIFYIIPGRDTFFTKHPGLASPAMNLFKVFDSISWMSIILSTVVACLVIYILLNLVDRRDDKVKFFDVMMHCNFAITSLPDKFLKGGKFSKISTTLLLGTVILSGTILSKAFGCNLNAILQKPEYEKPMDYACQMVEKQMVHIYRKKTYQQKALEVSDQPCYKEAAQNAEAVENVQESDILYRLATDSTLFFINDEALVQATTVGNPIFEALPKPWFHKSKDVMGAAFSGWMFPKKSIWLEKVSVHTQHCHQAGFLKYIDRMFDQMIVSESGVRAMGIEHFLIGYILILFGYTLATLVFLFEIVNCNRFGKRINQTMKTNQ